MWHDHPFSQRSKTTERGVGVGVCIKIYFGKSRWRARHEIYNNQLQTGKTRNYNYCKQEKQVKSVKLSNCTLQ